MADQISTTPVVADVLEPVVWSSLDKYELSAILAVNIGSFLFACLLLRIIWPPPTQEEVKQQKELELRINEVKKSYSSMNNRGVQREQVECLEGDSAGSYDAPWTDTFDLIFLIVMSSFLFILVVWTQLTRPELWTNPWFWLEQIPKVLLMMSVSIAGGFLCRYFCEIDEKGYILTNRQSAFKVNYTRKLQHFAAYLVPLLMHTNASGAGKGPLTLAWGNWVTLLGFLILIKPIRERFTFVMLQFNALDRPEDRPNTLSWIVGGNILPGCAMIILFRWLFSWTDQQDLSYIFIFITGIGDGLAEPVGIYLGKHKYWTTSCFGDRRYQRSFEGSSCVFLSSIIFTSLLWYVFKSPYQFWTAMIILPPLMTYSEATSPHTIDTPFLMGLGGLSLFAISHMSVLWL